MIILVLYFDFHYGIVLVYFDAEPAATRKAGHSVLVSEFCPFPKSFLGFMVSGVYLRAVIFKG